MKSNSYRNRLHLTLLAAALGSGVALAGPTETVEAAPITAPDDDVISGTLSLDANSHFISYGNDVWGDGNSLSHPTFNPMVEIAFDLPNDLTLTFGTWWDMNSKITPSAIGGKIQEIDLWTGLSYTYEKFTIGVTYQAWNYASSTEQIIDVGLEYDCFLSPSLLFHNRLDAGGSGGADGTVMVLGLSHSMELGPVSVSFPVNFATFLGKNFHNATLGADSGYGYTSAGVNASYPLTFLGDTYGSWDLHGALTYFWTNNSVTVNNPENSFLTWNAGLGASL